LLKATKTEVKLPPNFMAKSDSQNSNPPLSPAEDKGSPKEGLSHGDSQEPTVYSLPASGSLGILALGAKGIIAWRKIRDQQS